MTNLSIKPNINDSNNNLVTKSNNLAEAQYKLTLFQQKLILLVISKIQPQDEDFKVYKLNILDIKKNLGISVNGIYTKIKKMYVDLLDKKIVIYNDEKKSTLMTHWFSSIEYFHRKGSVDFCFDPKLKPYLIQLKNKFVSYSLKNIISLKSIYSIRIYELLKQYEGLKKRSFLLDDLKRILNVKSDILYGDFKRKVLKVSYNELASKTDISFTFTEYKVGREVKKITFKIISVNRFNNKQNKKSSNTKVKFKSLSSEIDKSLDSYLSSKSIEFEKSSNLFSIDSYKRDKNKKKTLSNLSIENKDKIIRNILLKNKKLINSNNFNSNSKQLLIESLIEKETNNIQ